MTEHSAENDAGRGEIEAIIRQALHNARDETYRAEDINDHAGRVAQLVLTCITSPGEGRA